MRQSALVAIGAAHRGRADTLHTRTFVGHRRLDVEPVHVHIQALLLAQVICILNRRTQHLLHQRSNTLLGKGHRIQCLFHAAALDQIEHQLCLLRAYPLKARFGPELPYLLCHNVSFPEKLVSTTVRPKLCA